VDFFLKWLGETTQAKQGKPCLVWMLDIVPVAVVSIDEIFANGVSII
jgi:hypothetical protein